MHLDERDRDAGERVPQGDARVRERAGVDDDEAHRLVPGRMDPLDQRVLGVALERRELVTRALGRRVETGIDVGEGVAAVHLRLARAEQVQVRPMNHEYAGHRPAPPGPCGRHEP